MVNTTTPPAISSLDDIADRYDGILCDVWGVLHNGVTAFPGANPALEGYRERSDGRVVLVTNAPRPNGPIKDQLSALGIRPAAYDAVVTSGDVTLLAIRETPGDKIYHVGPERDINIFDDLEVSLTAPDDADMVVCTGLFDDESETPEDYREELSRLAARSLPMICANPDLVVHRGGREVYCAGALAELYAELGGNISVNGKPHAPIYRAALDELNRTAGRLLDPSRVLAIGDAFRTDVKGAVDAGLDCLLITSGIHYHAFGPIDAPDPTRVHAELHDHGLGAVAFMPWLA